MSKSGVLGEYKFYSLGVKPPELIWPLSVIEYLRYDTSSLIIKIKTYYNFLIFCWLFFKFLFWLDIILSVSLTKRVWSLNTILVSNFLSASTLFMITFLLTRYIAVHWFLVAGIFLGHFYILEFSSEIKIKSHCLACFLLRLIVSQIFFLKSSLHFFNKLYFVKFRIREWPMFLILIYHRVYLFIVVKFIWTHGQFHEIHSEKKTIHMAKYK